MPSMPETFPEDRNLWSDFQALCEFGGRLTGTPGEVAARDWSVDRLRALGLGQPTREPTAYTGWTASEAKLVLAASGEPLDATALLCSGDTPPAGVELEVVDCGRGSEMRKSLFLFAASTR